jgi:hypothetical protein
MLYTLPAKAAHAAGLIPAASSSVFFRTPAEAFADNIRTP